MHRSAWAATHDLPHTSIVVPARNCADELRLCLESIQLSDLHDFEIIVVDDASTDHTAAVAEEFGVRTIRLQECGGPAAARNLGAEAACGEILVFLDADVSIHPETLTTLVGRLDQDQTLTAVFGSYDDEPGAGNLVSQYRNLLHHFVHQSSSDDAMTFWAGCGAVRTAEFRSIGGFDAGYRRPAVEDIEFGYRLRNAGHRIALEKKALCKHMKRWRLWSMISTDIFRRGLPWTILIFKRRMLNDDLNLKVNQRLSIIFTYLLVIVRFLAVAQRRRLLIAHGRCR
ncbi:MAG: glycosyltransferase family 2 protein [Planctomycetaceae bacterium]|nr:glycosyltransferase family 2 protein [Planctomycetaceae bacterium]